MKGNIGFGMDIAENTCGFKYVGTLLKKSIDTIHIEIVIVIVIETVNDVRACMCVRTPCYDICLYISYKNNCQMTVKFALQFELF